MKLRLAILFPFINLALGLACLAASAQARVDPSLPEAPLPQERSLSLFPGYERVFDSSGSVPPLSCQQKFETSYRMIASVSLPVRAGITSMFDRAVGVGPFYGPGGGGFAKLYAYNAANVASSFFLTDGLLPVVFHQDPRYFPKRSGSAKSRIIWTLRSNIVAPSDSGRDMPNYASLLGFGMSAALSDAYLPSRNVSFGQTMESIGIKEGVKFGFDLSREFEAVSWIGDHLKLR